LRTAAALGASGKYCASKLPLPLIWFNAVQFQKVNGLEVTWSRADLASSLTAVGVTSVKVLFTVLWVLEAMVAVIQFAYVGD
jgi:hypothetical protein